MSYTLVLKFETTHVTGATLDLTLFQSGEVTLEYSYEYEVTDELMPDQIIGSNNFKLSLKYGEGVLLGLIVTMYIRIPSSADKGNRGDANEGCGTFIAFEYELDGNDWLMASYRIGNRETVFLQSLADKYTVYSQIPFPFPLVDRIELDCDGEYSVPFLDVRKVTQNVKFPHTLPWLDMSLVS